MSTTIDNRVVEMRFDNKNFENNVQTSISTLEKLKQSLNLSGAAKGLENVDAAAKKVDMTGLGSAVESVQTKFSAMQVMAVTALANITNSAVNAGKRIVSALTIDPIKTGFSEYETKINAIQTIMSNTASKGTTMDDVTRVIGELNTYADKTIYNFAEMTRNIGTFTAAGVGLEESASAIQGIANLAAASGSTSQQASTAMYQLSQALAAGTVKLMDWNSVVNAGMGGEKFQEALKSTAKEHGVAVDDLIKKHGSFRESLTEGWITADILNETLSKFTVEGAKKYAQSMVESGKYTQEQADALIKEAQAMEDAATKVKTFTQLWDTLKESAQSGWSQTWEIIVGDFEEAKETLTKFSEVIGGMLEASANARNELLQGWKDAGGRADLIDSLFNAFDGVLSIVKPIKEAFKEIFPPLTVDQLVNFTKALKDLTSKFKLSETASNNLKRTFKGLFAVLDIAKQLISATFKAISPLFGSVDDLGGGILGLTASFGDWLVRLRDGISTTNIFNKAANGIAKVITFISKGISGFVSGAKKLFSSFGSAASNMGSEVSSAMESMGDAIENCSLVRILKGVWDVTKTIIKGIGNVLGSIVKGLNFSSLNFDINNLVEILNGLVAGGVGIGLIRLIDSIKGSFDGVSDIVENVGDIFGNFAGIFENVGGVMKAYQNNLNGKALMKIAGAIAILAGAILILSIIDSNKLYESVIAIGFLFAELVGAMAVLGKSVGSISGVMKLSTTMIAMSASVLILAGAVKKIAELDFDDLCKGLLGIAGLMAIVVGVAKILGSGGNAFSKGATQMVILAAAVKILASVCEDLSYLSWEEMAKGLVGVGILLAEISLFLNTARFGGKAITTATGVVIIAAAIKILASACEDFGMMEWGEIGKGLTMVGALLAEVAIFTKLTGNAKHVISTGIALIAISAAIKIFASSMSDMARMTLGEIGKGLFAMAGALAAVTIALRLMPKNMIGMGVGLVVVSAALLVLASAFGKMGSMSWEGIAKGMVALGGSMIILAAGLHAMNGTLAGSAALIIATGALVILTSVLKSIASMEWSSIAKGFVVLAGAFVVLGIAGAALQPVIPAILGLAGAMALIGVGILALGVGLTAAGAGVTALAAGLITLVGAVAYSAAAIVDLVFALVVGACKGLAAGIVAFCEVITAGLPAIGEAIKSIILVCCDVIIECIPPIVDTLLKLVVALIDSLVEFTPKIVDGLFNFLVGVIDSLARNIPPLIKSVANLLMSIFTGAIDALGNMDSKTIIKGLLAVGLMAGIIAALAAITPLIPVALAGAIGMGAVITELAIVLAAVGALAQLPGLEWLISEGGTMLETIGNAIGKFVGGIAGGIAEGFTSSLPKIASDLSEFMTNLEPFIEGASMIDSSVVGGVASLVGVIMAITAANVVDGIASWLTGNNSVTKFAEELPVLGEGLKGFSDAVAGIVPENIVAASNAAKALAEMTKTIPNEGGVVGWFTGENSISKFASELPALGEGLKGFSDAVAGVVPENIIAASEAAKVLTEMTKSIPNEGGVVAWFTGENSISKFATDIVTLGEGLKGFSDAVIGVVPENIVAASNAAKSLAEMTKTIPNNGGVVAWFTGENSISKFAADIVNLGGGLKGFSDAVSGIVPENVLSGANAAKALAEMTAYIPNTGGMKAWFVGEASISTFADQLPILGGGLKGFSDAVTGINAENMTAAANAAKALAEMTAYIPNAGGVAAWFTGEASISKFSSDLVSLGEGLKGFSDATIDIKPETMTAAANSAKALAEMTSYIPNEGGVSAWFTGESSVANFADKLPKLGEGLKGFSNATTDIKPDTMTAAANAAKALAEMTQHIPKEGGIVAWFTGESSIANFADKLPTLGKGLTGFSESVAGINPENVTAAASAAKDLAKMTETVPKNTDKIIDFGNNLKTFGEKLAGYFDKTKGITAESTAGATTAINAVKEAAAINSNGLKSVSKSINDAAKAMKNLAKIPKDCASQFTNAIEKLGKTSADSFLESFDDLGTNLKKKIQEAMDGFVKAVDSSKGKAKTAFVNVAKACAEAISDKARLFRTAGKNLVLGMAEGISANSYKAEAKARAMAKAAAKAAEEALDINSPSKVGYGIGNFFGLGFVNALDTYASVAYDSGSNMADSAKQGLASAISKIRDFVDGNLDTQPTIRPVLDLSGVRSGAGAISSIFGSGISVSASSNAGAIGVMMNRRNQNGEIDNVITAIDKLRKDLNNADRATYNINGITYDDGSNIADAVETIVRAARRERRI